MQNSDKAWDTTDDSTENDPAMQGEDMEDEQVIAIMAAINYDAMGQAEAVDHAISLFLRTRRAWRKLERLPMATTDEVAITKVRKGK